MNNYNTPCNEPWFEAWNAIPRDGPAVFVKQVEAVGGGAVEGAWIDPTVELDQLQQDIVDAVGTAAVASASWHVVDQIGVGPTMLSEDLDPASIRVAALRAADAPEHLAPILRLARGDRT